MSTHKHQLSKAARRYVRDVRGGRDLSWADELPLERQRALMLEMEDWAKRELAKAKAEASRLPGVPEDTIPAFENAVTGYQARLVELGVKR
jgi:hypothetical protein